MLFVGTFKRTIRLNMIMIIGIFYNADFKMTGNNFFGHSDGKTYSLILSESGIINGTKEMEDSSKSIDVGLICNSESTGVKNLHI